MLSLMNNYKEEKYLGKHPLGNLYIISKDEYDVHFEKCVIDGVIPVEQFKKIRKLKYNSYIIEYEKMNDFIVLESINILPDQLNEKEVKKLIIDLFNAVNTLQERKLYVENIQLKNVYKTKNHYKLDCYNVCETGNYKILIQDVCHIGLNIIDNKKSRIYRLLKIYMNPSFQSSIPHMIEHLQKASINKGNYLLEEKVDYKKKRNILFELILYIITFYPFLPLIIILFIIILII